MSESNPNQPEKKRGVGLVGLVKAFAFLGVLVAVELVAAAMFLPSAAETEALAKDIKHAAEGEESGDGASDEAETARISARDRTREAPLGEYNITRFAPDTDKTLNVDFAVFGVVLEEEEAEFLAEFDANKSRIEEQIVMTMHSATSADLAAPGLGLIKRQILEKTNRALGRPLLREVVFTRLNFVER